MKDSIHCVHVHNKVNIVTSRGAVTPCCDYFDLIPNDLDQINATLHISELSSFNEALTRPIFNIIKEQLSSGNKIENCRNCWKTENNLLVSRRTYANKLMPYYKSNVLEELEIALDFTCNMMCRSCGPNSSSKWKNSMSDGLLTNLNSTLGYTMYGLGITADDQYNDNINRLLDNSDFKDLKVIRIVGGEPFYSKKLESLLDKLHMEADIKNLIFYVNTNASIIPSNNLLKKLLQMKKVQIDLSIDAVGDLASVIRYGVEWKKIEQNVIEWAKLRDKYPNIIKLTIHSTLSLLNINKMQELIDFAKLHNIYVNVGLLHGPQYLSINQLPVNIRQRWKIKSNWFGSLEINSTMCTDIPTTNNLDKFLRVCNILDDYQGKSFKAINPEMYNLIEELKLTGNYC